jgi:hypothetical protein
MTGGNDDDGLRPLTRRIIGKEWDDLPPKRDTGNGKVERMQVPALGADAEVAPVMKSFDDTLCAALGAEPPR